MFLSDNLSGIDYNKLEVISDDIDKVSNKISMDLTNGIKYLIMQEIYL
ncbi:hypothetical protein [Clostridium tertium]